MTFFLAWAHHIDVQPVCQHITTTIHTKVCKEYAGQYYFSAFKPIPDTK